jgi:hypothetical protein
MLAGSRRRAIMQDVIGVLAIWRYPVKAMLGEPLDAVEVARGRAPRDEAIRAAVARLAERLGGT